MKPEHLLTVLLLNLSQKGMKNNTEDAFKGFLECIYGTGKHQYCKKDCGGPLFLTPLIDNNKLEEARNASYVNPNHFVPGIHSHSGYITVEDEYNSNVFFWFFPVKGKSVEDTPLLVWTQGGPGAPSTYGLFIEIGPFSLNEKKEVEEMEYSWAKNHSILFIDAPVGAGYSFTDYDDGYATDEILIGEHLYSALQQILDIFPKLRKAPTYLAGSLYGVKHAVSLGIQIHRNKCNEEPINLKGFILSNGLFKAETQFDHAGFGLETGLILEKDARGVKKYQALGAKAIRKGHTEKAYRMYNKAAVIFNNSAHLPNPTNFASRELPSFNDVMEFLQQSKIRKALHVGNKTFTNIGLAYQKLIPDIVTNVASSLQELLNYYKVLFINGFMGTLIPLHPSEVFYNSLEFDSAVEFRLSPSKDYIFEGTFVGYYRQATNIYYVCLLNSGNIPTIDNPKLIVGLITKFVNDRPLQ